MKKGVDNLTLKQRQALPHFLTTSNITAACKSAGITTPTYYEWVKDTAFGTVLEQQRAELREEGYLILRANLPKAASTLVDLLEAPNEAVRRLAAKDIIELVHTYIDTKSIEDRLATLEERKR